MDFNKILTSAKQIFYALIALLLPFMGIGALEPDLQKAPMEENVRVMSFNVRNVDYERGSIVPQVVADYYPDLVGLQAVRVYGTLR